MHKVLTPKQTLIADCSSGLVVFLVALPLCLGIALASGAPFFSGMIAGIIGGIVIGALSNSHMSVSGPAAGLVAVVLAALDTLGSFEAFLLATLIAGMIQFSLGVLKFGAFAEYFPSGVIRGMLTAIGLIIIIKQIPHALGYDDDVTFLQDQHVGTWDAISSAFDASHMGAFLLCSMSLLILVMAERPLIKRYLGLLPAGLIVVVLSVLANEFVFAAMGEWYITPEHRVNVPVPESLSEFSALLTFPDISQIGNYHIYVVAVTLAAVASIETLLCIEATDKLDTQRRITDTNRELRAQGVGNMLSGAIGGLPITSVIVRSSANIHAGARTKLSTIIHGVLLLVSVLLIPNLLNKIPLSTLAAILLVVGYKLAHPSVFVQTYRKGINQFVPFIVTVIAILLTDLLVGVGIGFSVGLVLILRANLSIAYRYDHESYDGSAAMTVRLAEQLTFLNKVAIRHMLDKLPAGANVTIDASATRYMDSDITEILREFIDIKAPIRGITCRVVGMQESYALPQSAQIEAAK